MRRYLIYIAGASAAAGLGTIALLSRDAAPPARPDAGQVAAPAAEPADAAPGELPVDTAQQDAAAAEETAALNARIDELTATLAAREADLASLQADLAERDARLDEVTEALAAREAELATLRDEIATLNDELARLRERHAFEVRLAELKADPPPELDAVRPVPAAAPAPEADEPEPSVLALTAIHFDMGSASLSPGGQVHAAAAAVMLAEMTVTRIRLLGFTDRVGNADRNRALAGDRARAVADFLVAQGVPAELIEAAPMGEDGSPVTTEDGVPEPLNRSVSIVAIPLPTS
jgi:outer membrane protein OmpA-like peptidoglycan-associated protein